MYAFVVILSAGTGVVIPLIASYLLTRFQLDLDFYIAWWPVLGILAGLVVITISIGMLNSRDVVNNTPLEVLRKENS